MTQPMTSEEHIRDLSQRVIAAPENSEEFRIAMDELHAALKMSVTRGREKIAALQRTSPILKTDLAFRSPTLSSAGYRPATLKRFCLRNCSEVAS